MIIHYRQGIVQAQQTPPFVYQKSSGVCLSATETPIIITFSDRDNDYLFIEAQDVQNAWSEKFNRNKDYWLYWDLDYDSGLRSFGFTEIKPSYGSLFPKFPKQDEHFFNIQTMEMFVWNRKKWVKKLRVFAAKLGSGGIITPYTQSSQVNITQRRRAGTIIFDSDGIPCKTSNDVFVTTETDFYNVDGTFSSTEYTNIETHIKYFKTAESIPAKHCVSLTENAPYIQTCLPSRGKACFGVCLKSAGRDEMIPVVFQGEIWNKNWNFVDINIPVWVGKDGAPTVAVPQLGAMQRIGSTTSRYSFNLKVEPLIFI